MGNPGGNSIGHEAYRMAVPGYSHRRRFHSFRGGSPSLANPQRILGLTTYRRVIGSDWRLRIYRLHAMGGAKITSSPRYESHRKMMKRPQSAPYFSSKMKEL